MAPVTWAPTSPAAALRLLPLALVCLAIPALVVVPTPEITVALAAGLIVLVVTLLRPSIAVALLLALVPFSGALKVSLDELDISPTEPLFALFLVSWALRATIDHRVNLPRGKYLAPVATLLVIVMTSALVTDRFPLTAKESIKWMEILLVAAYVGVHFRETRPILGLLATAFGAASIEALYGVYQFVSGSGPASFAIGPFMRAYGHFGQPNPFAGYLASVLPLAIVAALAGPVRWFRLTAFVCLGLAGMATAMSLSRGAWMGLLLAVAVMLLNWRRSAGRILAGMALAAMVVAILGALDLIPPVLADRIAPVVEYFGVFDVRGVQPTPENFALIERLAHWQAGWEMFVEHPILGVGAGNYPARYDDYALPGWPESLGHAHNYYLNMAAEAGVGAAIALVWVLGSLIVLSRASFLSSTGFRRALALGLLGSTVVFTVHSMFDNLLVNSMAIQVGVFLGLAIALHKTSQEQPFG